MEVLLAATVYYHTKMSRELDAIVFGATGFSGQLVVQDAVTILKDFRWGIAGRNRQRMEALLKQVGKKVKQDLSHIPIIVADVSDKSSIEQMTKQCRVRCRELSK